MHVLPLHEEQRTLTFRWRNFVYRRLHRGGRRAVGRGKRVSYPFAPNNEPLSFYPLRDAILRQRSALAPLAVEPGYDGKAPAQGRALL